MNTWRSKYLQIELDNNVQFDWSTDGCSSAPDKLLVLDLLDICAEHDFCYRNAKLLKALGIPVSRLKADNNLFKGIRAEVKKKLGFSGLITATLFYVSVRSMGWRYYGKSQA